MSKLIVGVNDLATQRPDLAKEWHPTKNGDLKPYDVTCGSAKKVWWLYPYDDPITGKHFDFEWEAKIEHRNRGNSCPYLCGKAIWIGFNDLTTTNPELAKEWHPTKNGDLKPYDVTCGSNKKVWWLCSYDDPITCKHFDFEWEAKICDRNRGDGCPYLNQNGVNKKARTMSNTLAIINPELVKEWHPTKNGYLTPYDVSYGSNKKVWWLYPYDDPITGNHFEFEWEASIQNRNNGSKCPYLDGHKIWIGFNDLTTTNPELAKEWHPTKNGDLTPYDVTRGSDEKVWWLYSYDDPITNEHFEFEWEAKISKRSAGAGCPYLNVSKTEHFLHCFLREKSLNFITEKTFKNLKRKSTLRYDIFLPKYNVIIECDGIQHFKPIDFFGGKKSYNACKKSDNIKNTYCKENKIAILRIPYVYDVTTQKDVIEKMVLEFIEKRTIPEEIKNFYSQFAFSNYLECVA